MADTNKQQAQGRRQQASRLQRIAPASLEINRPTDWNVAIPLLSPLVTSPADNLTDEINRKGIEETEMKERHNNNKPTAATAVATTMKKWQHPAAPFSYEPAPFAPFIRTAASDMENALRRSNKKVAASTRAIARSRAMQVQSKLDMPVIPLVSSTPPEVAAPAIKSGSGRASSGPAIVPAGGVPASSRSASHGGSQQSACCRPSASPTALKRPGSALIEPSPKSSRREACSDQAGQEVESPEVLPQNVLHHDAEFLARAEKGTAWKNKLAESIGRIPCLLPFSRNDPDDVIQGYGKGLLSRVVFEAEEVSPEASLVALRRSMYEMIALFSVGMSKLEAAHQGVVKLARENAEAESVADLKAEVEKQKELLKGWSDMHAEVSKEKGEVDAELARVRKELEVSADRMADFERAKAQMETDHAAELAKLKQLVEGLEKQVTGQAQVVKAAAEKEAGLDDLIFSQYDAGCFHILRLHQASVRSEDRLTVDQMLEWKTAHIFREDLRVFHPEIPYSERDLELFAKQQLENEEVPWVAPPVASRNLLALVREYDNPPEEVESPLEDMHIGDSPLNFNIGDDIRRRCGYFQAAS